MAKKLNSITGNMAVVRIAKVYDSIEAAEAALLIAKKDLIMFGYDIGLTVHPDEIAKRKQKKRKMKK